MLAHLTGDPALVTTIDIQSALVHQANRVVESIIGPGLMARVGNGYEIAEDVVYDRIIATAKAPTIPDSWIAQLAAGGKLVMNLGGQLAGGLLVAQKRDDGGMYGSFLPLNLSFMPMQIPAQPSFPAFRGFVQQKVEQVFTEDAAHFSPLVFHERDFRFFLQWHCPGAALEWWGKDQDTLLPALFDQGTLLTFLNNPAQSHWVIQIRGSASLWQQVLQVSQEWDHFGRPSLSDYDLTVSQKPYQKHLRIYPKGRQGVGTSLLLA